MAMVIKDISKELPWKASVGKRPLKDIRYAVIHHEGFPTPDKYNPIARYKSEANAHIAKDWGHIGYHYKIDRQGVVYQCYDLKEIGYHAGNLPVNKIGIGICLDGSFDKQKPTQSQLDALKELLDYLFTKRPDMPLLVKTSLNGHREVRKEPTYCPSDTLMDFIRKYRS